MARPRKTGLDYFPFDVDFFDDEKIVAIAGEFGLKGEIAAVKLLCAVYRNGYFIEWSDMLKMKMLRSLPGINAGLLEQIVDRLVKWGFFDKALFDSAKVLTSRGIQKRYFNMVRGRAATAEKPYLIVSASETGVSYEKTGVSYEKTPQSKVNKRKESSVEDKKTTPPTPPERSLDREIGELKSDAAWIDAMRTLHHADADALMARLDDFRLHCAASGLEGGHPGGLRDAKSHFNNWLRVRAAEERKTPEERRTQADADRRAAEERERAEERRERDRFTPPPGHTSLSWYREIKRRAEAGDPEAARMLSGKSD